MITEQGWFEMLRQYITGGQVPEKSPPHW